MVENSTTTTTTEPKSDHKRDLEIASNDIFEAAQAMGDDIDEFEIARFAADSGDEAEEKAGREAMREAMTSLRNRRILIMAIANGGLPADEEREERATETPSRKMTAIEATDVRHSVNASLRHFGQARFHFNEMWRRLSGPLPDEMFEDYAEGTKALHELEQEIENIANQVKDDSEASS